MVVLLVAVLVCGVALGFADGYQAVTGKRLSKRPSVRTDEQMRRQSAVAAVLLLGLSAVLVVIILAL